MKKIYYLLCLAFLAVSAIFVGGCGSSDDTGTKTVALAMPNSSDSWKRNGEAIKQALEREGFVVMLEFADTAEQQNDHIKKMIESKPKCIVIGAVDSIKLADVLKNAKEENIPIIAYDRLIMQSDAISYYVTFDNEAVGAAMGEYLEAALNLKTGAGPFNIEFFAGDPADNNAHLFFSGAMKVLQPYLDSKQLVCPSGETTFEKVNTKDWKPENATVRMEKLLDGPDAGLQLDAILSPNDGVAGGIIAALNNKGYSGNWPLITGQDCDPNAIKMIQEGKQAMTISKPPATLSAKCVRMIKSVVEGTEPDINDITTYNNGVLTVPSYLCTPRIINIENIAAAK